MAFLRPAEAPPKSFFYKYIAWLNFGFTGLQGSRRGKQGWEPAEACDQAHVFQSPYSWCIYCGYNPQGQV